MPTIRHVLLYFTSGAGERGNRDLYTVELERTFPENNNMSLRTGGFSANQTKSASTPADLRRILASALEGGFLPGDTLFRESSENAR